VSQSRPATNVNPVSDSQSRASTHAPPRIPGRSQSRAATQRATQKPRTGFWARRLLRFRFLFLRFSPSQYYFSLPLLVRNLLIAFAPAMSSTAGLQVLVVTLLLVVYLIVQLRVPAMADLKPGIRDSNVTLDSRVGRAFSPRMRTPWRSPAARASRIRTSGARLDAFFFTESVTRRDPRHRGVALADARDQLH